MIRAFSKISLTLVSFILSVQLGIASEPIPFEEDDLKSSLSSNRWGLSHLKDVFGRLFVPQKKEIKTISWQEQWDAIVEQALNLNTHHHLYKLNQVFLLTKKLNKTPGLNNKLKRFSNNFAHSDDVVDYFWDYFQEELLEEGPIERPVTDSNLEQLDEVLTWNFLQDATKSRWFDFVCVILQQDPKKPFLIAEQSGLFSASIEKMKDLRERDFFMKARDISDLLVDIALLHRKEDQLPILKKKMVAFYTNRDGGELSASSQQELRRLGISYQVGMKSSFSISKAAAAGALIGLTVGNHIVTAAAQRPAWFSNTCKGSFKECASAYVPLSFGGFMPNISTMQNDVRFRVPVGDMALAGNKTDITRAIRTGMTFLQYQTTPAYYSDMTTFQAQSIPGGNVTRAFFTQSSTGYGPFTAEVYTSMGPTQYSATFIHYLNYNQIANASTTLRAGSLNPYYLDQFPNSETWVLSVLDPTQSFGVGTAVVRPEGGTPRTLWQRLITPSTTSLGVNPENLPTAPVNAVKPSSASAQDGKTFDEFIASVSRGPVATTDCKGIRSLQQFIIDHGLLITPLYQGLTACFQQPGLDPLACANHMIFNTGYTRLTYHFSEGSILYKRVVDGPTVRDCTYRAANASSVIEECQVYPWNPTLGAPNFTNITLPQSFAARKGSLVDGQVQKIAELYYSDGAAMIPHTTWTASGTSVSYYAFLGPDICASKKRSVDQEPTIDTAQFYYNVDLARLRAKEAEKGWYEYVKQQVFGGSSFDSIDPDKMSPEQWYEFYTTTRAANGDKIPGITLYQNGEHIIKFTEASGFFGIHRTWVNSTVHSSHHDKLRVLDNEN